MRRIHEWLPVALVFLLAGCGGGVGSQAGGASGVTPVQVPAVVRAQATSRPHYSVTYLPIDSGCRINEPPQLTQAGIVAVSEICAGVTQNGGLKNYVYDNGAVSYLSPTKYTYIEAINSSEELAVENENGTAAYLNFRTGATVPLKGSTPYAPYASSINDYGYAAGDVCARIVSQTCVTWQPVWYYKDGTHHLLSSQQQYAIAINYLGSTLTWAPPNSAGDDLTYLYEKSGTVLINRFVGPNVSPAALADNNDVLVNVNHPNGSTLWKAYLVTHTDQVIAIPPLPGWAQSIGTGVNTSGQVVADACNAQSSNCIPFLFTRGSTATNGTEVSLNSVGSTTVDRVYAINNKGVILAAAQRNGQTVPALLTP